MPNAHIHCFTVLSGLATGKASISDNMQGTHWQLSSGENSRVNHRQLQGGRSVMV